MEILKDPCNDRTVKSVPLPPVKPLAKNIMYPDASSKVLINIRANHP